MQERKMKWPWFGMFIIASISMLFSIGVAYNLKDTRFINPQTIYVFYFLSLLWPFILFVESLLYYKIRAKIYNIQWVKLHVIFMAIAFVILPLLWTLFFLIARQVYNLSGYRAIVAMSRKVRPFLFAVLFIAGTVFFILNLIKSYANKTSNKSTSENDLLDDDILDE